MFDNIYRNGNCVEQEINSLIERNRIAEETLTNQKNAAIVRERQLLNELAEKNEQIEDLLAFINFNFTRWITYKYYNILELLSKNFCRQFEIGNINKNANQLSERLKELQVKLLS